jgi:hypothetical protein
VPDGGGINVGVADGSSRLRTALVLVLPLDPVPRIGTQFFSMSRLPTSGLGGGLADWATGDERLGRGRSRTGSGAGGGDHEAGGGGSKEGRDAGGCVRRGDRPGIGVPPAAARDS